MTNTKHTPATMYANGNLWDSCFGDRDNVQETVQDEFKAYPPFDEEGFASWSDRVTRTIELENAIALATKE